MNIVAIVQARMGSTRFPGKVMLQTNGLTLIQILLERLSESEEITKIVVATTFESNDNPLANHVRSLGYDCEKGSESDVLDRYVTAARAHAADIVIRITGDCPLIDAKLVDLCIREFKQKKIDYLSNNHPPSFPDGLDVEVFSRQALEKAADEAFEEFDREHVTPYLRLSGKFLTSSITADHDYSDMRWTVDEPEDFDVINNVVSYFSPNVLFGWAEVLRMEREFPGLFMKNKEIRRNEGSHLGKGQKLWKRAKRVIPGGNMLLSKRPEMFLPEQWPSYFSRAKGCEVWTLDGRKYTDMSMMGIGTNILGYGNEQVDASVSSVVTNGNMSTLNCPEEVYLAEKLVELHPWAEMVKFARSGGEANAIAVRIARAASGRDNVAICGYHGWHDWYLAANLGDEQNLKGHLLPGLQPNGVPEALKNSVFPFEYNNFDQLKKLVDEYNIGTIKMEVERSTEPKEQFLQRVRKLAIDKGIVLIFDECTSGFRETFGGIHKKYEIEPDICVFGKALGNGYAITAIIGRREIMEAAQASFISSTFWTERIGPSAALATLRVMEELRSWETITNIGTDIKKRWQQLANKFSLKIEHSGIAALAAFNFTSQDMNEYKTLISQEMLKGGYLASNAVYAATAHTPEVLDDYFEKLEPIFSLIAECEDGRNVQNLLEGPVCHNGFKRLN